MTSENPTSLETPSPTPGETPVRIGLSGAGRIAHSNHVASILANPGLQLAAIFDPDATNAAHLASLVPAACATFTDYNSFLASDIQAVTITSPAPVHERNVIPAIEAGLPVLCEKPLAQTEPEMERIVRASARAGVPVWTAFCYRFAPPAMRIAQAVRDNEIGDIRTLRLIYNWDVHGALEKGADGVLRPAAHRFGRMMEGGPIVDCGVHQIDLARWWLKSEVIRQHAEASWVTNFDAPDHVFLHLQHDNGAHTMVEMSYSYGHTVFKPRHEFVYELIGTAGFIRYDRLARSFILHNETGLQDLGFAKEKNFTGMYTSLSDALHGRPHNLPTAADGMAVSRIAWKAVAQCVGRRGATDTPGCEVPGEYR